MPAEGTRKRGAVWYFTLVVVDPDTGIRRRPEYRAIDHGQPNTQEGARRARRAMLARLDSGFTPSGRTIAQLITRYIDERGGLKPRSRYVYSRTAARHITPYLGARLARDLSPGDVRGWHVTLSRAGLSPATIALAHAILSGALGMEVADQRLPQNVASLAPAPAVPHAADPPAWDESEILRFIADAAHDAQDGALWTLLILTGIRIGEALALTWGNVELDAATLHIRATRSSDERGRPTLGPPKSAASRRSILLPPDAIAQLRAHRDRTTFAGVRNDAALVFPIGPNVARARLLQFCAVHGYGTHVTPHDLRHVHISWLAGQGFDPLAIIARAGHSDLSMLRTYAHQAPGSARALADAMTARLDAARAALDDERGKQRGSG